MSAFIVDYKTVDNILSGRSQNADFTNFRAPSSGRIFSTSTAAGTCGLKAFRPEALRFGPCIFSAAAMSRSADSI